MGCKQGSDKGLLLAAVLLFLLAMLLLSPFLEITLRFAQKIVSIRSKSDLIRYTFMLNALVKGVQDTFFPNITSGLLAGRIVMDLCWRSS